MDIVRAIMQYVISFLSLQLSNEMCVACKNNPQKRRKYMQLIEPKNENPVSIYY